MKCGYSVFHVKIKVPKHLPQYVEDGQIEKLLSPIRDKESHKHSVERDLLIVELYFKIVMRRNELMMQLSKKNKIGKLWITLHIYAVLSMNQTYE